MKNNDNILYGWVEDIQNDKVFCILRKDYRLDNLLTLHINNLTTEQKKLLSLGVQVKFNLNDGKLEFLTPELNWI